MSTIQATLHTIWVSLLTLGIIRVIIAVLIIGLLARFQKLLGLLAAILFIAFLAHWI
ncbi:MAG: hypothetical protein WCO58_01515 [bacterium]